MEQYNGYSPPGAVLPSVIGALAVDDVLVDSLPAGTPVSAELDDSELQPRPGNATNSKIAIVSA